MFCQGKKSVSMVNKCSQMYWALLNLNQPLQYLVFNPPPPLLYGHKCSDTITCLGGKHLLPQMVAGSWQGTNTLISRLSYYWPSIYIPAPGGINLFWISITEVRRRVTLAQQELSDWSLLCVCMCVCVCIISLQNVF